MFNILTKSRALPRRSVVYAARWASQAPPKGPTKPADADSAPATPETGASSSSPLDAEAPAPAGTTSSLPSLDISPGETEPKFERTGATSSRDNTTSSEKKRRTASRIMMAIIAAGLGAQTMYMGRDWEEGELKGRKLSPEDAPTTRWGRTKTRYADIFDFFTKPPALELLPPPLPPPHGKPYTLVLSLDDLLVTSAWDRTHGWRTAKRPGLDYFLHYLSQFYEIVVFSSQSVFFVEPIITQLDKYNWSISHRLGREHTRLEGGTLVKDLTYLNRDLSKVIIMDTVPEHVRLQPENAIVLPPWKGDPRDKGLVAMIPFLESIGIYKPADVRPIIKAYEGKNIPVEYAKQEAAAKARHVEEWNSKNKNKGGAGAGSLTSLFGLSSAPQTPRGVAPPTYLEQKRRLAQQLYLEDRKYLEDHKEEIEKFMKQQQDEANAQTPHNLWEALAMVSGQPQGPDPAILSAPHGTVPPPATNTTTPKA